MSHDGPWGQVCGSVHTRIGGRHNKRSHCANVGSTVGVVRVVGREVLLHRRWSAEEVGGRQTVTRGRRVRIRVGALIPMCRARVATRGVVCTVLAVIRCVRPGLGTSALVWANTLWSWYVRASRAWHSVFRALAFAMAVVSPHAEQNGERAFMVLSSRIPCCR